MPSGGNNKGIPHSLEVRDKIRSGVKKAITDGRLSVFQIGHLSRNPIRPKKIRYEYDVNKPPTRIVLRRWLIEELGEERCSICGWNQRRPSGVCPLQINHIDGNHGNWEWTNLELICPNCHSLTPKFLHYDQIHSEDSRAKMRARKLEPLTGIEPASFRLQGERSSQRELQRRP